MTATNDTNDTAAQSKGEATALATLLDAATARPWQLRMLSKIIAYSGEWRGTLQGPELIAIFDKDSKEQEATARLAVVAVNHFAALVEALTITVGILEELQPNRHYSICTAARRLIAAIERDAKGDDA